MKVLFILVSFFCFMFASVDINTADIKELSILKGVGKVKAEAIVKYRTKYCFKSVDEIIKVKGIGKKILDKNKNDITVSKCKK